MGNQSERLGGRAFNHKVNADAEQEYDRLRDLARDELGKYHHFAAEASKAYNKGDGARAHEASEEGKRHAQRSDDYNRQASEFIFRENNAVGKVEADAIDLHGQYVEEAEMIVTQRIEYAQQTGQQHLHIIVGKGNHSPGHIQKIKPAVEQICTSKGLQFHTEHNEGRIYVDLTGGQANPPPPPQTHGTNSTYGQSPHSAINNDTYEDYGKPHYETAYPMGNAPQYGNWSQGNPGNAQAFDYEKAARRAFPVVRKIIRSCCVVM